MSKPRVAAGAPAAPVVVPAQQAPATNETFVHRAPVTHHHGQSPTTTNLPAGPSRGTFSIDAPVLGALGTAAVRTVAVDGEPRTGAIANKTTFSAPTVNGTFALQQVVQRSGEGVVSANLTPQIPTAGTTGTAATSLLTYSSDVSTSATQSGNVLVNVRLVVGAGIATSTTPVDNSALDITVQAVYTPDVTQVLAETVTVVEGSPSCCVSTATPTLLNTSSGSGTSPLPPAPAAVSSASVSPMSLTRRDDQAPAASS